MNGYQQLSLAIALDDQATFDNFYAPNGTPQHMATFLLKDESRKFAYLFGAEGCGLTHLLQAVCQQSARGTNAGAVYLPMAEVQEYPPEQVLEGLEHAPIVCLDDLDLVAYKPEWQEPLFHFFNRCRDADTRLVVSAHLAPDELDVRLQDLLSRLKSGVTLQMMDYRDADRRRLLQYRASSRGLYLSDEVALFMMHRLPRNTRLLMEALAKLDSASLQEQRRLTLPFVKTVLNI
ncbi:MAG: DnaA regulatory inactivator Hda [Porticoccaceae bacterium]|nr:DnaA regulatory inactivator Hda [Porticoccaceae bacterium]